MDIYQEIALFFNEPVESVKEKCAQAHTRLNRLWEEARPSSEAERIHWYKTTDAHIYEGANWHNNYWAIRQKIASKACGKILLFGSGIGTEGIMAAEMGKDVTFYDLQGLIFDFLKFRIKLRNISGVKFIDKELEKIERDGVIYYESSAFDIYDTIICIDVLEHLEYPQAILNFLGRHLSKGGVFLVSSPFDALEYLGHLPGNKYMDIDLMCKIAKIKHYRKDILIAGDALGSAPFLWKILLVRLVNIAPISDALKHKMLYLCYSFKIAIKVRLNSIGLKPDSKLYIALRGLLFGK